MSGSKKDAQVRSRRQVSGRMPLKDVVADCERRWFEAALEAAKNGEVDMQSLVGQMFCSGYGVAVDVKKGKFWLEKSADANEDARILLTSLSAANIAEMDSQTIPTQDSLSEPSNTEILKLDLDSTFAESRVLLYHIRQSPLLLRRTD